MSTFKASPHQSSLFEEPGPNRHKSELVTVTARRAPLTKRQREFNRLTDRIRRQRALLAEWEAYLPRFEHRLRTELGPIEREIRGIQQRLVQQMDKLLTARDPGDRLSRRHRRCVRAQLLAVIDDLLADGPDPALEALYDRHSEISREQIGREELAMMESALGSVFGTDVVQGHAATDIDGLLRHAQATVAERAAAEERERRERAAERKARAERDASRSVRDIFRKLASALHPDREADGMERERKTAMMQRVNRAYENGDLLELLTLQIEIEQMGEEQLTEVPDERLKHFNLVLREQLDAIDSEIGERVALLQFELHTMSSRPTPSSADRALTERIYAAGALAKEIASALAALADRGRRREVLDALPDPDAELDDILSLAMMMDSGFGLERRPARRKSKSKSKKQSARGKARRKRS